jgi:uncharacterized repeat protein (TIGR04138 family)
MSSIKTSSRKAVDKPRYHQQAYHFVFDALHYTQERLGRSATEGAEAERHISGRELLEGIRAIAVDRFGLMTRTVFKHWGIHETADFGRIVFELIDRREMRKTDQDSLEDFFDVYDFDDVFDRGYRLDVHAAFR